MSQGRRESKYFFNINFVKVFCPKCEEIYIPKDKNLNLDGSFFGVSFPHVFLAVISIDNLLDVPNHDTAKRDAALCSKNVRLQNVQKGRLQISSTH